MDIGAIVRHVRKAASDNSPAILTAIGVAGATTTAILAGKASFKAARILGEESPHLEFKEKVGKTWQLYIPTVGTGVITITCIVVSNRISTHRAEALASAYIISQEGFKKYKEKVLDKLGEKKEQEVRDDIAQDKVDKNPPGAWILTGTDVLCLDLHSGRYFDSDMEKIRKAENDINFQILHDDYASLTDFWERIGLPRTTESDEIGWNTDSRLQVRYSSALVDGKPCLTIEFTTTPVRNYDSHH